MSPTIILSLSLLQASTQPADIALMASEAVRAQPIVRAIRALQQVPGRTRVMGTRGAEAARRWLSTALQESGIHVERQAFEVRNPFADDLRMRGVNLVARVGPREGRALVFVAHLDTKAAEDPEDAKHRGWQWARDPAPGADDNASGSAALLEVARRLAMVRGHLRRPVVLAWTDAEELAHIAEDGFMENLGAEALARSLVEEGADVEAALSVDMLLRPRAYGFWVRLYEDGFADSSRLALIFETAAAAVAPELVVERRLAPSFTFSDHGSFWAQGQGGVLLIEDDFHHARYHQDSDAFDVSDSFYDVRQVLAATRAIVATALTF